MSGGVVTTIRPAFDVFLMKNDASDSSNDTDSTCSTDIETSLSNQSLSIRCDELESPQSLRHRGHTDSCAFDEEVNEYPQENNYDGGKPVSVHRKRLGGKLQPLYRVIPFLVAVFFSITALGPLRSTIARSMKSFKWRRFLSQDARKLMKEISKSPTGLGFTIRLKGSRVDLLRQSLDAHAQCSSVDEIQIEFEGHYRFPQVLYRYGAGKTTGIRPIPTGGLLLLEEGIILSCEELDNTFKTWKRDPRRFVGFFGSSSHVSKHDGALELDGVYSILSDRAAFVHRRYLDAFSPFGEDSCCDSLLSMRVSLTSKKPPVLMKARPQYTQTIENQDHLCVSRCEEYLARFGGLQSLPDSDAVILGST